MAAGGSLDITSAEMLEQLITTLRSADIDFALADLRQLVLDTAHRTGLIETLGEDRVFHTIDEAVQALGTPNARDA